MPTTANIKPTIIRTKRGLSIRGTRTTLYQIMDCLKVNMSPIMICDRFRLTLRQMNDIMTYINQYRDAVETEYLQVLATAEENRLYWKKHNLERFNKIAKLRPKPERKELWKKLQAWKALKS